MDRHSPIREGHGRTWAKAILLGEHSVVYGHPAVAMPLHDLQMRATATPTAGPSMLHSLEYSGPMGDSGPGFACIARAFEAAREFSGRMDQSFEIVTTSDFPHERGMGSSAAAAGAVIRAVLDACGREASADDLFALTQMAEQIAHGRPSGLDAAATSSPCPIRFQGGQMRPLAQRIEGAQLVIADSGVHGRTREAVEAAKRARTSVAVRAAHAPEKAAQAQALLRLIGALVRGRSVGQREVVALVARGMSGKQIAQRLGVTEQAVSKRRLASAFDEEVEALPLTTALIEALSPESGGAP